MNVRRTDNPAGRSLAAQRVLALACLSLLFGCSSDLETSYGVPAGAVGADSVNGTAVLAKMFSQAGSLPSTTSHLSPFIWERADVIVWAPDSFQAPSKQTLDWFDSWWQGGSNRTLIYIGRDFDAAPGYWQKILPAAAADQKLEIKRRLGLALNEYVARRQDAPNRAAGPWFDISGRRRHRRALTLSGPWAAGINAGRAEIELNGRTIPPADTKVLLASNRDVLVSERNWSGRRLILVDNGSFLLNLPLVNHEHRKLAGKLIASAAPQENMRVYFLSSGPDGPQILDKEPEVNLRGALTILDVAPFDKILLHLGLLAIVFCVSRWPIFGPARSLVAVSPSDFGRHVWALGSLLERTRDHAYATARWLHYQQSVRRESGRFRRSAATAPLGEAPLSGGAARAEDKAPVASPAASGPSTIESSAEINSRPDSQPMAGEEKRPSSDSS